MIEIKVTGPADRDIYVNGVFSRSYGRAPVTITTLDPGTHDLETLRKDGNTWLIDFAATVTDVPDLESRTIELAPVVPPREVRP